MKMMYEIIMTDGHCPSETCSLGLFHSRELAIAAISKESVNYSDHMTFEVEEKYVRSTAE